ncbi:hypothetical protein LA080_004592 [Diaporthe eres]|nr:hypothetical protein LA080_004592 [Diaporthe eres]
MDLFKPLPPLEGSTVEKELNPLTIRSVVLGLVFGSLVSSSNVYLGLKTGFVFSANMFGAIFGFGVARFLSQTLGHVPVLGNRGVFGPSENNMIQATASGADGLSGFFVAAVPAMYRLSLLSDPEGANPVLRDFGKLTLLTLVCATFGLCWAVPFRKFFIVHVARELNLLFPSATAVAFTIRSMHGLVTGAADANRKLKGLAYSFMGAFSLRVASNYAIGLLWDWHIFTWFYIWGNYNNWAINIENWGWYIDWTPAFIGSGLLVGLNVGISYFLGSVLAWRVIEPLIIRYGVYEGRATHPGDEKRGNMVSFLSLSDMDQPGNIPSPRYWLLWPGVMIMVCYSFAEMLSHWRVIWMGMLYIWANLKVSGQTVQVSWEKRLNSHRGQAAIFSVTSVEDINPTTAAAKASQLVFGGVTSAQGLPSEKALSANIIAGAMAAGAADISNTIISNYRTGFLLKTPLKPQFWAQAAGAIVSVFLAPGIFMLFVQAYPCVIQKDADRCAFTASSVAACAQAVTMRNVPIPRSFAIFARVTGFVAVVQVILKSRFLVDDHTRPDGRGWYRYRKWLPNWVPIGMAFVLPATHYSTATLIGALTSCFWAKKSPWSHGMYCYAVAAGFIAGEGLGGVVQAVLEISGVSGSRYGTSIGCPGDDCY